MNEINALYKCQKCGNVVEVLHGGAGELVCCGEPMAKLVPGTSDGAAEKHVPVIEKIEGGYLVKVGSVPHPMLEEHYIEFVELICQKCGKIQRKYLKPGDAPEVKFKSGSDKVMAREYCNLHGLWKAEN